MATSAANRIQPLADRVVVQAAEETEQTRGGLYIPDTAQKEKPQQGTVLAVGPGRLTDDGARVATDVSVGDSILYGKYSGTEVTVDDEEFLIIKANDILAIITD